MRIQIIIRYVGLALLFNSIFFFISGMISLWEMDAGLLPLWYSFSISALIGIFPLIFVPSTPDIRGDESLIIVIFSWILCSLVGALPYVLYGGQFTFTNAWFESVSGFTTTGSTILTDIEALPKGLLFWRSTTHFIGGIGIIIFLLAVIPSMNQASMILYKSEVSALAADNFQYRTQKTLQIIVVVYVGLILLETLLLWFSNVGLFDALTHSFATVATGGFSTKNSSIAYYDSLLVESIVMIFMILSGIHFGLIFVAVTETPTKIWKSTCVKYYLAAMMIGVLSIIINLHGRIYPGWLETVRYAAFQLISLGTSTGFATTDTASWPPFSILVLILFSLQCACAGSTSGGIKVDRIVIFWKAVGYQLKRLKHPRGVIAIKIDGSVIHQDIIMASILYILVYLLVVFLSTIILAALNIDILSAFSGSVAAMGNVGPGFGMVSSLGNFSQIPDGGKWVLSTVMLLGRLEIYGFLMLFIFKIIR